ncbi:MAG: cell division protein FtsL [Gammaproteobacteria bacterium]|nr:cell division protein FtsL [Gammaproteobacteria bacterium]
MNAASKALAQTSLNRGHLFSIILSPQLIITSLLAVAIFLSGLTIVYNKNIYRDLFIQLHSQQQQTDNLQTTWSQLLLEQSTWSRQARIQRIANQQLNMFLPSAKNVVIIQQ